MDPISLAHEEREHNEHKGSHFIIAAIVLPVSAGLAGGTAIYLLRFGSATNVWSPLSPPPPSPSSPRMPSTPPPVTRAWMPRAPVFSPSPAPPQPLVSPPCFPLSPLPPPPKPSFPPPFPPFPPPPPPLTVAEDLNRRFRAGSIAAPSTVFEAGVLVHQFDFMDASSPEGEVWIPGSGEMFDEQKGRCCKSTFDKGDRISATIINAAMQPEPSGAIPIFSFGLGGILLSPRHNSLLCSYPYDVGSMSRLCSPRGVSAHCVPGCTHPWRPNAPGGFMSCHSVERSDAEFPCAWKPSDLSKMLQAREHIRSARRKPLHKDFDDHSERTMLRDWHARPTSSLTVCASVCYRV